MDCNSYMMDQVFDLRVTKRKGVKGISISIRVPFAFEDFGVLEYWLQFLKALIEKGSYFR